jgi:membrane protein DedA with SNARE-associated domain
VDGSLPLDLHHTWQAVLTWFSAHESLLIFLAILFEESGIPMPLPADLAMALAGHRVAQGRMSLLEAFLIGQGATLAGSSILYWVGRRGGRPLLFRYGSLLRIKAHRLAQVERMITKLGPLAIIIGRQIPGLRLASPLACGVFRVPYLVFLPAMIVGSSLYIGIFIVVGMWGGNAMLGLLAAGNSAIRLAVFSVLLVGAGFLLQQLSRRARDVVAPVHRVAASHRRSLEAALLAGLGASTLMALVVAWFLALLSIIAHTPPERALLEFLERSSSALPTALATGLGRQRIVLLGLIATVPIEVAIHMLWAAIYAFGFERHLRGKSALRGLQFSVVPWVFNGLVLFPLLGAGPFALGLGTGGLPAAGEFVRQAVFGTSLGMLYRLIRLARQPRVGASYRHGHRHRPDAVPPDPRGRGATSGDPVSPVGPQGPAGVADPSDSQSTSLQPVLTGADARYAAMDTAVLRRIDLDEHLDGQTNEANGVEPDAQPRRNGKDPDTPSSPSR